MGAGLGKRLAKEAISKSLGAVGEVQALKQGQQQILMAVRNTFGLIDAKIGDLTVAVQALSNLVGKDAVEAEVTRIRVEEIENKAKVEEAAFKAAVTEGKLVPAETVGDLSVIIGTEVDKDGTQLHPIRIQMLYATLKPEFKKNYTDRHVGDIVETPLGSKFTVQEIFNVVIPKEAEAATAPTAEVAPAPAAEPQGAPESEPPADEEPDAEAEQKLIDELSGNAGTASQSN